MTEKKGKRVLKDITGETLWAEYLEPENDQIDQFSDQEEYDCSDDDHFDDDWKDLSNGVTVFLPSVHEDTVNVRVLRWTNEMRAERFKGIERKLPTPSIVATDIFEICKKNEEIPGPVEIPESGKEFPEIPQSDMTYQTPNDVQCTLVAEKERYKVLTLRVKADKYEYNDGHFFYAIIRSDKSWSKESARYLDGEFWFHASSVSTFFIFASAKVECFNVDKEGLKLKPDFNESIAVEVPDGTVNRKEQMRLRVWPSNKKKLSKTLDLPGSFVINAVSDTVYIDHKSKKLNRPVTVEVPMYGQNEMEEGDHLFRFACESGTTNYEYERMRVEDFNIHDGVCSFQAEGLGSKGYGIVKTKAESVRPYEIFELTEQSCLCQFLYYKVTGATDKTFELWIECAKKEDIPSVIARNELSGMTEFPHSRSDDIPVLDKEEITVTVGGGVRLRGSKSSKTVPFFIRFLSMSETNHVKIPLVKHQAIDGAFYADVNIVFSISRQRKPILSQLDPWGRIVQLESKTERQPRALSENDCFREKSLQALALVIPTDKAKKLGRELDIESEELNKLLSENEHDMDEFITGILVKWKQLTESSKRLPSLTDSLKEIGLDSLASIVENAHRENRVLRSSDFKK